ncbi:hypothetical protein [Amphritea pacifica]|uniref:hypothetical protein n=1 Tax=Amphritea pacifica TaxID=2811233 RepID=UPI001963D128|nr:hypothetical protein [Amphritea pacifica]MBN1005094.1 hypothetical protein [Amphritea pacifica]
MLQIMRYGASGFLLLLCLTGCASDGHFGSQNYIVDLDKQCYCIEGSSDCHLLSLINPSFREGWIADAYGMPKQYYSWSASELANLLINPPDNSYQPEPIGGGQYRLPPTFATHMVWDVLAMEYFTLYRDDDGFMSVLELWPQPRRFSVPH